MYTLRSVLTACMDSDLEWVEEYAEPGYTAPKNGVLLWDWNDQKRRTTADERAHPDRARIVLGEGTWITVSNLRSRLANIAERAGYAIEWSDEWARCDDCHRVVRTVADCYFWTPSYIYSDGNIVCRACWAEMSIAERIPFCVSNGLSPFAARRSVLPTA